ncbi:MAG: hypothetical protein ACREOJ_17970 [Gemmatimonadaceae bacterium]
MPFRWCATTTLTVGVATLLVACVARTRAADAAHVVRWRVPATGAELQPPSAEPAPVLALGDIALGLSGALRASFVGAGDFAELPGATSGAHDGVLAVPGGVDGIPFSVIQRIDFSRKLGSFVGRYQVGYWPAELHAVRSAAYANPHGFVEVTPANEDTRISSHFTLRDFLTHDQPDVWPKYIVLRAALLDKLELVLQDLALRGVPTSHVEVLSGFRTPSYNFALGDASGRARESRHQYGDAADIIIDANHDGRMDDLNHDGRVDARDVRLIEESVQDVERAHPELAGGLGLYDAMGPSGPFAHIDVRGEVARWTRFNSSRVVQLASRDGGSDPLHARPVARCYATGASAVLCATVHGRNR